MHNTGCCGQGGDGKLQASAWTSSLSTIHLDLLVHQSAATSRAHQLPPICVHTAPAVLHKGQHLIGGLQEG